MLESRVISTVDHLTEWCATMVVTTKLRSEVRVCVDLTKRNEYVQHENHSLPSVDLTLGNLQVQSTSRSSIQIPDSGWKLKDHSQPSSHLGVGTVLMCCLMDLALVLSRVEGLEGVECNIDDALVHVPTIHVELHDYRLERLEHLSEASVTLNINKCTFRVPKIKFLGNDVSVNGIEVVPGKLQP